MSGASNCAPLKPANGILGENYDVYGANRTIPRSMTAFTVIAWYNCILILILIFFVFKRYSGLYFWSLLITTLAVVPYTTGKCLKMSPELYTSNLLLGSWIKQNTSDDGYLIESLVTIGWVTMIPGQSLVLYSRLHLITQNENLLRFILWLIIVDAVLLIPTSVVLSWTASFGHLQTSLIGYTIFEKIQMSVFTAQELIISATYLWEIRKIFNVILKGKTKNILWQVVAFNVFIICLDTTLLTIEFFNLYMVRKLKGTSNFMFSLFPHQATFTNPSGSSGGSLPVKDKHDMKDFRQSLYCNVSEEEEIRMLTIPSLFR
jgi:hypothetical protein